MKWFLYKDDGSEIGPLTAEEIRDGLREGHIDPFDLVARDGSTLRRQLLEIDELFELSDTKSMTEVTVFAPQGAEVAGELDHGEDLQDLRDEESAASQTQAGILGRGQLHLAAQVENDEISRRNHIRPPALRPPHNPLLDALRQGKRGGRKQYLLAIGRKNTPSGPYSASEIFHMFKGKPLEGKARVIRLGLHGQHQSDVSLEKFLRVFEVALAKPVARGAPRQRSNIPTSVLAQRVREGRERANDQATILAILAVLMLLAAGLIIGVSLGKKKSAQDKRQASPPGESRRLGGGKDPGVETRGSRDSGRQALKAPVSRGAMNNQKTTTESRLQNKRESSELPKFGFEPPKKPSSDRLRTKELEAQRRQKAREDALREEKLRLKKRREELVLARIKASEARKERERNTPKKPNTPAVATALPVKPSKPPPSPPVPRPSPPPPAPKPAPSPSGLADGSNASRYGPLSCPKSMLTACQGSCTITCSGPQGAVTIMYFKGVWGPKVESKHGSLFVSGFVRKEGSGPPRIIVNDVQ